MINKQRCSADNPGRNSQRKDPAGKNANAVKETDGKTPMEFRPVVRKPGWEGPNTLASWSK